MLTHPGGPQNMIAPRFPDLSRFLSNEWGPVKCFCPMKSSRLCGRSLSARGVLFFAVASNARLLVSFSSPTTGCTTKDETSSFRFFWDGSPRSTSEGMVDMRGGFGLLVRL